MKTCVTFSLAALVSSLVLPVHSLHAADAPKATKAPAGVQPVTPATPKPIAPPGAKPSGTPAPAMPPANAPAPAAAATIMSPDLVVEKPVADGSGMLHSMEWTVRNIGDADAHSTTVSVKCEVIYSAYPETNCIGDTRTFVVPPLAKGATYKHKVPQAVKIDTSAGTQGEWKPYRVKFSAVVDPDHKIQEKSESNNALTFLYEEASGPPPVARQGGGLFAKPEIKLTARLTLKTEDPWNPGNPNWVLVKNDSPADAPAVQVKFTCMHMDDYTECHHPLKSSSILIQPLAMGQGASVKYLAAPIGNKPQKFTFKLQGVEGAELVLNRP